jgi:hypothetical protein
VIFILRDGFSEIKSLGDAMVRAGETGSAKAGIVRITWRLTVGGMFANRRLKPDCGPAAIG